MGVDLQNTGNEVLSKGRHDFLVVRVVAQVYVLDVGVYIGLALTRLGVVEGRRTRQKFVGKNSYGPIVDFVVIWYVFYDFWG